MSSVSNASEKRNPLSTSFHSHYQKNVSFCRENVFPTRINPHQKLFNIPNGVKFAFNKEAKSASKPTLSLSSTCKENMKSTSPEMPTTGLRVFSVPVRRVRGLTAALNKLDSCPFIFETVGRIVECKKTSSACCVLTFRLEERSERPRGVQLKCQFEDVDEICPEIFNGRIYRCVGKFSMHRSIFQCYSIAPCNDVDLQLLEIFQMHSDNVIAQMLSRN
ncbi:hypothetical protein ECG_04529 [Echinococcus granulosus]|uniref:Spermatogenesis associated protein 22 n=2 Tax=Echinococcus granulosus TaxID=6210 RepID=A0A068WHN8_ECHGR|nr:hypothetical protein ECG_04529 [Echinococcus granulosus]CDS17184.1 spermatogenesis associated protein 22 [Echinococcus granulosus]